MTGDTTFLTIMTITGLFHRILDNTSVSCFRKDLFEGSFFTPELMVCGDITGPEIKVVWDKATKCEKSSCYDLIYKDQNFDLAVFAPKPKNRDRSRQEL